MMTPMSEDGGPLREWAPLTNLLQQIPVKLQSGIFTQDINFTCIDAVPEFIAIGTNCGLVYWFDRASGDLQRLRCENSNSSITSLRVISTVDYMVAAGNNHGVVTVFQIPKNLPESLPDSLKPKQKKQIERYNIGGLHKSPVSSVEWSKNGMKLFSGDQDGLVVLTEIDFYMHLSKSSELLNEKYAVVQLSYQQGLLLVSTLFRTILVDRNHNSKVSQVGQKERKTLGKLGAVFATRQTPIQEPIIYASRPGLRLWEADKNGTVMKTLIFKEALQTSNTQVLLLNPAPETLKKKRGEPSFGVVLPFCDDLFVTYSEDYIHVINPVTITITSVVSDLRKITDVACTRDEIFVLEGERNILRIAYHPESCNIKTTPEELKEPVGSFAEMSKPVTASIIGLTTKLKENSIPIPFYKISPSNIIQALSVLPSRGVDPNPVVSGEEATEMPPIIPLSIDTPLVAEVPVETEQGTESNKIKNDNDEARMNRRQIFQKISEQDFEDVVFTPERKNKKQNKCVNGNCNTDDTTNSILLSHPTYNIHETHSSLLTLSIDDDSILKAERDLETIQKDVETKEKLLADVLNFDWSEYMTSSQILSPDSTTNNSLNTITYLNCTEPTIEPKVLSTRENNDISEHTDESDEDESYRTELKKLETLGECSKNLYTIKNNTKDLIVDNKKNSCQNNSHDLEIQFNELSKEFVSSAIYEEAEDWVVV
ncbi:WD repeat-containing protein CG11141 [Microplitis mediator]|uniref:WD repeat-containing protein CG11141 n=1 Tax=Microplitis mediator TaxID=375433 RepID=UPI00255575CC|nr:WD repeat-containing protein CG11141 [Microplitis mediator]